MKKDLFHCSVHGAVGQGTKNGRCELCWPAQPITEIAQVIDLLEVELQKNKAWAGLAEQYQKILNYIKN